jgi:hypothetical protein
MVCQFAIAAKGRIQLTYDGQHSLDSVEGSEIFRHNVAQNVVNKFLQKNFKTDDSRKNNCLSGMGVVK